MFLPNASTEEESEVSIVVNGGSIVAFDETGNAKWIMNL